MRLVALASLALLTAALMACASSHPDRAEGSGGRSPQQRQTQTWAEPASLFLVGLEKGQATLSLADFQASEDAMWRSADADGDGIVRSLELQAWRRTWFGSDDGWPGLFHFDQNSDGVIDKAEFKAGLEAIFTTFDKNKDGVIDRVELLTERVPEMERKGRDASPSPAQGAGQPGSDQTETRRRHPGGRPDGQ